MAVDHLSLDEVALEIGSDKVDAADFTAVASGIREERAGRGMAKRGGKHLVVIDAGFQGRALNAQASFGSAVALRLIDPDELVNASARRYLVARDRDPGLVSSMIPELISLGLQSNRTAGDDLGVSSGSIRRVRAEGVTDTGE